MTTPLLTRRAVVLSKIEGTYNTDAVPTPVANAILVGNPDFKVKPNILTRDFARVSISSLPKKIGKKVATMTFEHELRGPGSVAKESALGPLFRACGLSETQITSGAAQVGAVKAAPGNVGPAAPTWGAAASGSLPTEPVLFTLVCTLGGASGTAKFTVTPDANAVANAYATAQAAAIITTATPFTLFTGVTITPTFVSTFTIGDTFYVWWYPAGYLFQPISTAFESVTLYMYLDGVLHSMTGARGTFTFDATAGEYGKVMFTMTGQYVAPANGALPTTAIYEQTVPPILQNANLSVNNYIAVVNKISFDLGNTVAERPDVNFADGYNGVIITSRAAKGGIDPEMALVSNQDFWGTLAGSAQVPLRCRFGSTIGNQAWFLSQGAQYTGLTYNNRNSIRVLDAGLDFGQWLYGDDEFNFFIG